MKLYRILFKIHFLSSCISQIASSGFYNSGTSISLLGYSDSFQWLFLTIKDSANFHVSNLVQLPCLMFSSKNPYLFYGNHYLRGQEGLPLPINTSEICISVNKMFRTSSSFVRWPNTYQLPCNVRLRYLTCTMQRRSRFEPVSKALAS